MNKKKYSNNTEFKKICIAAAILIVLLAASVISLFAMKKADSSQRIATIYVDGSKYAEYDLNRSEDVIFTITSANGSSNTIEIKNHDIRMLSAECKNNLCVRQGWASDTPLPIVCLPNNIVITVNNTSTTKDSEEFDAVTY